MGVTPEQVLALKSPTKGFLCPLSANTYGLDFLSFQIRDYDSKRTIFEVSKDNQSAIDSSAQLADLSEDSYRKIKYNFTSDVLRTPTISTILTFGVGNNEVEDFRMIERHYFRDQLVKSYDFTFGFCIPNSTNTWEAVYAVPLLDEGLVQQMIDNPFETRSDSFYFVNDRLVMHNKAEYKYKDRPLRGAAESKNGEGVAAEAKAAKKTKGMKYAAKLSRGGSSAPISAPEAKAGAKAVPM